MENIHKAKFLESTAILRVATWALYKIAAKKKITSSKSCYKTVLLSLYF